MIDAELAIELRDAGWPQSSLSYEYIKPPKGSFRASLITSVALSPEEQKERGLIPSLARPSLPELIEACGGGFKALQRTITDDMQPAWEAFALGKNNYPGQEGGSTPEEAVGNLWLALNKKES